MNKFVYFLGLFLVAAFQLRALEISSFIQEHEMIGTVATDLSNNIGDHMERHLDSFIEMVSGKVVDKLETHLEKDGVAEKMMIMLQNNAELFDAHHYKGENIALIQTLFFNKLKNKFVNSKFGKKLKSLGVAAKKKLSSLYHAHKDKIKHFFSLMLKGLIIPRFVKFVRKNIGKWKSATLEAVNKMKSNVRKIAVPMVEKFYAHVGEKLDDIALKNDIDISEDEVINKIVKDEKDIEKLEKEEKKVLRE